MTLRQLIRQPFVNTRFATPADLTHKHMIVTGASIGSLGFATAKQLAAWGATVIITTRNNPERVVAALQQALQEEGKQLANNGAGGVADQKAGQVVGRVVGKSLDLASTASVIAFSDWYKQHYGERLDALINNAGIHLDLLSQWQQPKLSADGEEIQWRTNYLGTVQLPHNLLPLLKQTGQQHGDARVVNVVSQLHSRGSNALLFDQNRTYESWQAYGLSKLGLIHHSTELNQRFAQSHNLKSYSLHPGGKSGTYTNVADKGLEGHALIGWLRKLGAPLEKLMMANAEEGAQTQLYCAVSPEAKGGEYYVNCQVSEASTDTRDKNAAAQLWQNTQTWLAQATHTA